MKLSYFVLTFCLISGSAQVFSATAKTADTQMQGTSNDVEITRRIRETLTKDDSLSTSAQNVTIVTVGNSLTLKGEVARQDEIAKINSVARQFAGGKTINNELKVTR